MADRLEAASVERRIATAQAHLTSAEQTLAERRQALAEDEKDLHRLEHLSWSRILVALRGQHATAVERERAERDAAAYAAREAESRAAVALAELTAARNRLLALGDTEAAYAAAIDAKETWAAEHDPRTTALLTALAERRGALAEEERELREAHDAGVTAHQALADAASMLSSAHSWSAWDTFMGGGLVTDLIKHDRLDTVGQDLARANVALRRFSDELDDLGTSGVQGVDLSPLLTAFDVWFDNIFSDWAVLNRIEDARGRVGDAATKVRELVRGLRGRRQAVADELTRLVAERERLLTG